MLEISKVLARFIDRHAKRFFFAGLLFSITCLIFTRPPEIDGALTGTYSEQSYFYKVEQRINELFKNTHVINVKIVPEDLTLGELISNLSALEKKIKGHFSLAETKTIADYEKHFALEEIDVKAQAFTQIEKIKRIPFLKHLISHDGRSFLMEVRIPELKKGEKFDVESFDQLLAHNPGIKRTLSVSEFHIEREISRYVASDLILFVICILIISLSLTIYAFGNISVIFYTIFILFVSLSPILLLMNIFSIKVNVVTILAFPVVLVLSIADMIHLLNGWQHLRNMERVINDYIFPSFLTSFAVMVDFFGLMKNDIKNIHEFALLVSISVMLEFFIIFLYAPYLMPKLKIKDRPPQNILSDLVDKLLAYKKSVSLFLIAGFAISLVLIPQLKFHTTTDSFFPKKGQFYSDHMEINKDFNSLMSLSILVEPPLYPKVEGFKWDGLDVGKVAYTIGDVVKKKTPVDDVYSVNEIVDYYYKKGMPRDQWKTIDFANPLKLDNTYLIYSKVRKADDIIEVYNKMDPLTESMKNRARISFFSPVLLFYEIDTTLAKQLLVSILFSSISIMFIFYLLTNSIRNTVLAMLANVMPVSFIAIFFYFFHMDLNLVTALTSVICLGIVVDDTIHVLYRLCYKKEDNISELGDGMITTTLILSLGFGCLIFSSFEPTRIFGLISSIVFIIAVLSDLALLSFGVIKEKEDQHVS